MDARENSEESLEQTTRSIAEHMGVVSAHPIPGKTAIEIEYDPATISQQDLRRIVGSHTPGIPLQKRTLRLEGDACEACAIKLEKKVKKIPGVRKATATYIGKILCLTFDENIADERSVMDSLRAIGARITAYQPVFKEGEESLWSRINSGSLNEEISCVLGFLFLIASLVADHTIGKSALATWCLYAGAYFFCGQQGVRSAIASLRERVLDVDVLMVLAAIGAGGFSGERERKRRRSKERRRDFANLIG